MPLNTLIKKSANRLLSKYYFATRRVNRLTYLADSYGSDKGTQLSAHCYTRIYDRFFGGLRDTNLTIVEIGLLRTDIDRRRSSNGAEGSTSTAAATAPSLQMWKTYFREAKIFGFDIDDFSDVKIDNCIIVQGDMSSPNDLSRLISAVDRPIDILIEDGSHASHHQQIAFGFLFPHIASGGLYVIEDLHWQDPTVEKKGAPKTRDILRRFQNDGVFASPFLSTEQQKYIQANIKNIWLFDSLTTEVDDPSDALAVVLKK